MKDGKRFKVFYFICFDDDKYNQYTTIYITYMILQSNNIYISNINNITGLSGTLGKASYQKQGATLPIQQSMHIFILLIHNLGVTAKY